MKARLEDIADVALGQSFRTRLERESEGNVAVVQMKDLTEENRLDATALTRVAMPKLNPRQLLRTDDILFRARGQNNTAAHVDRGVDHAIAAAPLLRIRLTDPGVSPAYLVWWINQPASQAYLASQAKGTAQRMIDVPALKALSVEVPSLQHQQRIVELDDLARSEQRLLCTLADRRKKYLEGVLMRIASGTGNMSRH